MSDTSRVAAEKYLSAALRQIVQGYYERDYTTPRPAAAQITCRHSAQLARQALLRYYK